MSLCICTIYGCNQAVDPLSGKRGTKLMHKEVKSHKIAESAATASKRSILQKAEDAARAAMEAQIEEITTILASNTLADNVSGPSVHSAHSPIWSWDVAHPSRDLGPRSSSPTSKNSISSTQSPTPEPQVSIPSNPISYHAPEHPPARSSSGMHREEELIRVLNSELAPDMKTLFDETMEHLKCIGTPSSMGPPTLFPLSNLLERSANMQTRLEAVRSKSPAVLAMTNPMSKMLQRIDVKLKKAEKDWSEELAHISTIKTPSYGIPHDTGMPLSCALFISRLNHG